MIQMLFSDTGMVPVLMNLLDGFQAPDVNEILNPEVFSFSSIEGCVIIGILIFAIYKFAQKAYAFSLWCIGGIFFIQCMYYLGMSNFNNLIPVHDLFQYDILTAVAQLFVGTRIAPVLLNINEMLHVSVINAGNWFTSIFTIFYRNIGSPFGGIFQ